MELQGRYAQAMYYILILLALGSNISPAATSTAIVLGTLLVLVHRLREQAWPQVDRQLWKIIVIYFLLWTFIAFFSMEPLISLKDVFATFYRTFPLFFVMMGIKKIGQVKGLMVALFASVFITDAVAVWQFFGKDLPRATGMSNFPTFLASHMLMAIPALWCCAQKEIFSPLWRKVFLGLCAFSIVALFVSYTRGGWIAFFLTSIIYLAMAQGKRKKLIVIFSCVCLAVGLTAANSPALQQRIMSIQDMKYTSNSERLYMWHAALEMLRDYPLTGIGPDEYVQAYNYHYIPPQAVERPTEGEPRSGHTHPHNNILKRFAEGGILGGLAFLAINAYLLRRLIMAYRQQSRKDGMSFALMGLLIFTGIHLEGLTDTNFIDVPIMREFWMLMGMSLVADKIVETDMLE